MEPGCQEWAPRPGPCPTPPVADGCHRLCALTRRDGSLNIRQSASGSAAQSQISCHVPKQQHLNKSSLWTANVHPL